MLKKQTSGGNNEGNFLLWFHWSHLRLMFALLAVMQCSVSFWLEASAFSILLFLLSLHSAAWQQKALSIPAAYTPSRHWGLHQRFPHPPPQLHSFPPFFFNSTDAKTQSLLNGLALLSLTFDAAFILHSRWCCLSLQSNTENRSHALCLYYKCAAEV